MSQAMERMAGAPAVQPRPQPTARPAPQPARPAAGGQRPEWVTPARWLTVVLGVWAIVMTLLFEFGGAVGVAAQLVGGLVAGILPLFDTLYWLAALAGIWLIVAPFLFGYGSTAQILGILTGIVVTILAGAITLRRQG